ncbi:MAG: RidA family protein [Geminicoccaceae bacterium]|nr:RidA family protein [Geminicoccaceae bacterium]MCB9945258.1 RidA family protein [Geminicoccaceae bacterium]
MNRAFTPEGVHPGFGRYHQAVEVAAGSRLLIMSGLLGIDADNEIPSGCREQCRIIFDAIDRCLAQAGMCRRDIVHLRTYLTDAEDRPLYMAERDAFVADPAPASTLLFVKALARPAFRVEIEATAAGR